MLLMQIVVLCVIAGAPTATVSSVAQTGSPPEQRRVATQTFSIGGATIEVDFVPGNLDLKADQMVPWIQNAARAVTAFYGRFPVQRARIRVVADPNGGRSIHGTTWGDIDGFQGVTQIRLGQHVTEEDLSDDWTMTHELVHMALASLPDDEHWMEEGLATYVEPIARAQVGFLTPEQVWAGMIAGMPQGLPQQGDRGLNVTHTWGRTYWGGAMFCLVADINIRKKTDNRKGLQDALRAVVAAGGTIDQEWSLLKVLQTGDEATGTTVLVDMYKQWKDEPVPMDLATLWNELGVRSSPDKINLESGTPLAQVRQAITHGSTSGTQ